MFRQIALAAGLVAVLAVPSFAAGMTTTKPVKMFYVEMAADTGKCTVDKHAIAPAPTDIVPNTVGYKSYNSAHAELVKLEKAKPAVCK